MKLRIPQTKSGRIILLAALYTFAITCLTIYIHGLNQYTLLIPSAVVVVVAVVAKACYHIVKWVDAGSE